jgi:hypothetical protein
VRRRGTLSIRALALLAAAGFLGLALGIRAVTGDWSGSGRLAQYSGTALYASMVYAGVVLVWPRRPAVWVGVVATAFCWAVEAAQVTGIPAELSARHILLRAALGVHFDWVDILWYPAGIVPLVVVDRLLIERWRRSGRADPDQPSSEPVAGPPSRRGAATPGRGFR